MPSRHSHVIGGSSAARMLNCPGSVALQATLPRVTNRDSSYSIEGTALHSAMEMLITGKTTLAKAKSLTVNSNGHEVKITQELVHDALMPAMAFWKDFLGKIDIWQLETEVHFPGIEGAFGTADVIGRDDKDNITHIVDWKFGAGEGVKAVYEDGINEQLLFYACAARFTQPEYFPTGCRIALTIVQPRARGQQPITTADISMAELDAFETALHDAVVRSETADAPTCKGRWCRFQPCQTVCSHWTGALFDLEALTARVPTVLTPELPGYQVSLLDILNAAPAVENLIREARAQAHLLLGNGEEVPGWKLVSKRGVRQWAVDPKQLVKTLKLPKTQLYESVLKSPAQVEKLLKGKKKLPEGLATVVSSGTTIAPAHDKRPAVSGDPNAISKILLEVLGDEE